MCFAGIRIMDNYEKLLEMDTDNDSDVQLQLYKECIAGAGGGKSEAMEWLNLAVENGNEEAVEILNSINNENSPKENKYANLSMLQLLEMADYDYKAAKELYYNRNKNASYDEQINYLTKLCSFEEADCEDYENLAKVYYLNICYNITTSNKAEKISGLCKKTITACENAIEFGSKKAKVYLANILLLQSPKSEKAFEICNQVATEGSIYDKFLHYVILKNNVINVPNKMYLSAWEEELNNYPDFLSSNIGKLYNLIKTNDVSKIKDFEKSFSIDEYSEDEAIVLAFAFKICGSENTIVNNFFSNNKCLDFVPFLSLYMKETEQSRAEYTHKTESKHAEYVHDNWQEDAEYGSQQEESRQKKVRQEQKYVEYTVKQKELNQKKARQEREYAEYTVKQKELNQKKARQKQEYAEYVAKQEKLRQQEKQQEKIRRDQEKLQKQIRLDKEKKHKENVEMITKLCAVASLVLSIISIITCNNGWFILSIPSLALGIFSYVQINRMNYNGFDEIAKAGIVLSSISIGILIIVLIIESLCNHLL